MAESWLRRVEAFWLNKWHKENMKIIKKWFAERKEKVQST